MQNASIHAIVDYCEWCLGVRGGEPGDRSLEPATGACTSPDCPLYQFREGRVPEDATTSPMKAIRARCLTCTEGDKTEVRNCIFGPDVGLYGDVSEGFDPCPLWPLRFGMKTATRRRILASKKAQRATGLKAPGSEVAAEA